MAKKSNRQSKKRPLKGLKLAVLLLVMASLALGSYFYLHNHDKQSTVKVANTSKVDTSPAPAADNNANNNRKSSTSPNSTLDTGGSSTASSTPIQSTASFQPEIVSSSVNDGNLHIGTMVSGTTTGTCDLTAMKSGQAPLQLGTSNVTQDVNAYDCGVFNIATSKFPANGDWNITLSVTSNGATASTNTSVDIE
jgi:cytoskeletal protein RodZ